MAPAREPRSVVSNQSAKRLLAAGRDRQRLNLVGLGRFELPTSRLSSARSNQLSYKPKLSHVPAATCLAGSSYWKKEKRRRRSSRMIGLTDRYVPRDPKSKDMTPSLLRIILRKEVIQPQVPLRLPCYDFTPVADPTVVACLLAVGEAPSGKTNSHGVTGGVYKARERIHRSMLICDY